MPSATSEMQEATVNVGYYQVLENICHDHNLFKFIGEGPIGEEQRKR